MVQDLKTLNTPDKTSAIGIHDIPSDEKRKKVGNYIILKTIGEGSFAKVRLGIHLITDMRVSFKFDFNEHNEFRIFYSKLGCCKSY